MTESINETIGETFEESFDRDIDERSSDSPEVLEYAASQMPTFEKKVTNVAELTFDDKVNRAAKLLNHNPVYRHTFLQIISACSERVWPLSELEDYINALPGYPRLKQPPYFPIEWLCQNFALEERYIDAEGKVYAFEDLVDLTEDEFDDLVQEYAYCTTEVGEQVAEIFAPAKKITELLDAEPERSPVYLDLLEYLCEKHSTAQIISLVRDRPELAATPNKDGVVPKPSMFIDKLEAIGAISFDEGWQITPEGKEYVKALH